MGSGEDFVVGFMTVFLIFDLVPSLLAAPHPDYFQTHLLRVGLVRFVDDQRASSDHPRLEGGVIFPRGGMDGDKLLRGRPTTRV